MGGRGTYATGNNVPYSYKTVGYIEGAKVLQGLNGLHKLPEEAHSSYAYVRLDHEGKFHEIRFYNKNHRLTHEIAYHPEPNLDKSGKPVLHIHTYGPNFSRSKAHEITKAVKKFYKKYFKGVTT